MVLDTHAWVWWAGDRTKLPRALVRKLEPRSDLAISSISCWEVCVHVQKGRLKVDRDIHAWIDKAISETAIRVLDLTQSIATEAALLGSVIHGDPADRIIVATVREYSATLVTRDNGIRESKLVSVLW